MLTHFFSYSSFKSELKAVTRRQAELIYKDIYLKQAI